MASTCSDSRYRHTRHTERRRVIGGRRARNSYRSQFCTNTILYENRDVYKKKLFLFDINEIFNLFVKINFSKFSIYVKLIPAKECRKCTVPDFQAKRSRISFSVQLPELPGSLLEGHFS